MKKKVLLIVGGIVLFLIVIGSLGGSKNSSTNTSGSKSTEAQATPAPMKITARQLADDFEENQVAAESKWNGKLVEFSAKISNITDTGISFYNVASKDFSLTQISCKINDKQQLLSIKKEQTVTVRGIVGKQTIGVIDVSDCEIVTQ